MFCSGCRYNLNGQSGTTCPECGTAFDPHKPETYLKHPGAVQPSSPRRLGRTGWAAILLAGWGWAGMAALLAHWLVAWAVIGHAPVPMLDDPKYIGGGLMRAAHTLSILMLIGMIPAQGLCVLLLIIQTIRAVLDPQRLRALLVTVAVSLALMASSGIAIRSAFIGRLIEWVLD